MTHKGGVKVRKLRLYKLSSMVVASCSGAVLLPGVLIDYTSGCDNDKFFNFTSNQYVDETWTQQGVPKTMIRKLTNLNKLYKFNQVEVSNIQAEIC